MSAIERFKAAMQRCSISAREIAAEMTRRHKKVSHTTVNRWMKGEMPRLDQAVLLAEIVQLDLDWIMFGEGPAPWELTAKDRRLLWLAGVIGHDEAVNRLAVVERDPADDDGGFHNPRDHTEHLERRLREEGRQGIVQSPVGPEGEPERAEADDPPARRRPAK